MIRNKKNKKLIIGGVVLTVIVILIIKYLPDLKAIMNYENLYSILQTHEKEAAYIYFIISFLQPILLPIPEPVTVMTGCSVLGSLKGAVVGACGTVLGIMCMYLISRYAGREIVARFIDSKKLEKFNDYIRKNEAGVVFLLFIFPVLPDEVICAGAGLAGLNLFKFMVTAIIGKLITQFSLAYSVDIIKFNYKSFIIIVLAVVIAYILKSIYEKQLKVRKSGIA